MASYRVGIIGPGIKGVEYGVAYRFHPQTEVVAAADTDAETLGLFCDRFEVPGYADYREMLASERLDIVAAILPVGPNPDVVVECARAGVKAVQCEKPMAATLADADRMVEACRYGVALAVGDLDRNLPEYAPLSTCEAGELGDQLDHRHRRQRHDGVEDGRLFAGDAEVPAAGRYAGRAAAAKRHGGPSRGVIRVRRGAHVADRRRRRARLVAAAAAGRGGVPGGADLTRTRAASTAGWCRPTARRRPFRRSSPRSKPASRR